MTFWPCFYGYICPCSHPGYDDAGDGYLDTGALEQLVPQVHSVPEGDDVPLDGHVILAV